MEVFHILATVYRKQKALYTNEEFKQLDLTYRVCAILSDGQWYTADKIRQYSREKESDEILSILADLVRNDQAIKSKNGMSYRMSLKQMTTWRAANSMSMDAQPIPKLIYPRIFGKGKNMMTEVELFNSAPLHQVSILTFMLKDPTMIGALKKDLGYLGKFKETNVPGKYKLYALSNKITKKKLLNWESSHGNNVFVPGKFNSNNSSRRRELVELDHTTVNDLIMFYVQFSKYLVPAVRKTFNVYLNGNFTASSMGNDSPDTVSEGDSVIMQWLLTLIQTYDESRCVPFSYSIVMLFPRRAYDYSSKILGEDLNKFQLEKNRAIKRINSAYKANGSYNSMRKIDDKVIWSNMKKQGGLSISMQEYEDLNLSLRSWQKSYSQDSLEWSETGEPKGLAREHHDASFIDDIARRSDIHHAIILAAEETGDWRSEVIIFNALGNDTIASAMMSGKMDMIPDDFKIALAKSLSDVRRMG